MVGSALVDPSDLRQLDARGRRGHPAPDWANNPQQLRAPRQTTERSSMTPQQRAPHEIPADLDVTVVDHPLAAARLSTMRDARTDNAAFRAALRELTLMLIYEASRTLQTEQVPIHTPVARTTATRLANPPLLVPVLRAGLGMADQAHALIPEAQMGFVGLARDEET